MCAYSFLSAFISLHWQPQGYSQGSFSPLPCLSYRELPSKVQFLIHPISSASPLCHFYWFKQGNLGVAHSVSLLSGELCSSGVWAVRLLSFFPCVWQPFPRVQSHGCILVKDGVCTSAADPICGFRWRLRRYKEQCQSYLSLLKLEGSFGLGFETQSQIKSLTFLTITHTDLGWVSKKLGSEIPWWNSIKFKEASNNFKSCCNDVGNKMLSHPYEYFSLRRDGIPVSLVCVHVWLGE